MRKSYLILIIAIALFLYGVNLSGQGVSINEDGSSADNSAILDIKSTDKGLLIPRLTFNDASTASLVSNPATGLMIYNINGYEPPGYYFWDGSAWEKIYDSQNGVDTDWTINGNHMYSNISGNVGIGSSSPAFNFHILDGSPTLLIEASDKDDTGLLNLRNPIGRPAIFILYATPSEGELAVPTGEEFNIGYWNGSSFSSRTEIDGSGDVGIGTTSPTALLSVNGNSNKPGGGTWSTFSDFRFKENIEDYNKGLTELLQINLVSFKYKSEFNWEDET